MKIGHCVNYIYKKTHAAFYTTPMGQMNPTNPQVDRDMILLVAGSRHRELFFQEFGIYHKTTSGRGLTEKLHIPEFK